MQCYMGWKQSIDGMDEMVRLGMTDFRCDALRINSSRFMSVFLGGWFSLTDTVIMDGI